MIPVFDAYVMVDWSASNVARTGADSIWVCVLERQGAELAPVRLTNPPTRCEAVGFLADLLSDMIARDRVTLVGFDFAFGYPAGFARRLRSEATDWRGVWKEIVARVRDGDDNANNRFEVAAALNAKVSGGTFPFWGCPEAAAGPHLTTDKSAGYGAETLSELRLADARSGGPQPVWKLFYPGSVGGQTLLGIPCVHALRHHPWLAEAARIWPFETALQALERPGLDGWRLLFAEVYPSMISFEVLAGEVKDAAQVRTVAHYLAALDSEGNLAPLFAGPPDLDDRQRAAVETEEAWILGIETVGNRNRAKPASASRYEYVRDPQEIYRRSFAAIRTVVDVDALPDDIEPLAVRLVHACGEPEILRDLAYSDGAAAAGQRALGAGAPVLVDAEMVASGVIRDRLPAANPVVCTLNGPGVAEAARARHTTRSAAAVDLWRARLEGAVVAIGNAPTALFRLLELIDEGAGRPALILGFPVGFVGAAESKEALIGHPAGVPYVTLRGRRGGSAFAAAAVNALAGDHP
jgi:precorrin-8X/cobalt-precorrin-8 methylmutase